MRTPEMRMTSSGLAKLFAVATVLALGLAAGAAGAAEEGEGGALGDSWKNWHARNEVTNITSLQRGARNFMSYCQGCHSLKYVRYSRLAQDLEIPSEQLEKLLLPPGVKPADYVTTSMPGADAEVWFGKVPPDLSLMVRARGRDHIYQFLKTFYADPSRPTGANNLVLPNTAMPDVLSELEGVKKAVFKNEEVKGPDGQPRTELVLQKFETVIPGRMTAMIKIFIYAGFVIYIIPGTQHTAL